MNLRNCRVACIACDGFEEQELTDTVRALRDSGAEVDIISKKREPIQAFKHHDKSIKVDVDKTWDALRAENYDAVLLPGGALNADTTRAEQQVLDFLRAMQNAGKPIAAICHAPWELISAGLVRGRTLTAYHTIKDDILNAGGKFVDKEVVVDGNWITSRQPSDIPAFNREMIAALQAVPA